MVGGGGGGRGPVTTTTLLLIQVSQVVERTPDALLHRPRHLAGEGKL